MKIQNYIQKHELIKKVSTPSLILIFIHKVINNYHSRIELTIFATFLNIKKMIQNSNQLVIKMILTSFKILT